MKNKYRLSSNAFERESEEDKVKPKKIFFLSVEGNATEKEYFEGISANRRQLGINAVVDVQVLNRRSKDTNSAPQQVVELLEEYLRLRECGINFKTNYMPYIDIAIERAKEFASEGHELIDNIGCNL